MEAEHQLYLAPDNKTFILQPCTKIRRSLVGKTICFTGPQSEVQFRDSRVYKYTVVEEDVGRSASDMKLEHSEIHEDYVNRAAYSSTEGSTSQSDSRSSSPSGRAADDSTQLVAEGTEAQPSTNLLRQEQTRVPPIVLPPQTDTLA